MADLSPVIIVGAKRVLPSLYWAYRLYADPMRGAELWRRNQIKHPAYMPINFEALAR
jgi:prophage DNA circulation protein